jgi:hypothetical protein
MSKKSVICISNSLLGAERIVAELKTANFSNNDISLLFPDRGPPREFAHEMNTKGPVDIIAGAGTGGIIGGALGWIAGIAALPIPGFGLVIAAGPIMAALNGAAIGAGVGGVLAGLTAMGISESEAKRYEGKVKAGNILISVHTEDFEEITRAKEIFAKGGAEDIITTEEASGEPR